MMDFLQQTFLNNTFQQWALFIGVTVFGSIAMQVVAALLRRSFLMLDRKISGDLVKILAETVQRTKFIVLFIVALYAGVRFLDIPVPLANALKYLAVIAGGIQIGLWAAFLVSRIVAYAVGRVAGEETVSSAANVLSIVTKLVVWSIVLLLVIDNLGFNITTLIAGVGIGGIAIAMASQQILSDLFASLSILIDKPFKTGDFIIVGELLGTVEKIGLKTTRIRSLSGEELIFSNGDLLSSRIRNYKTMQERRVVFTIGVEYSTPSEKLKRIPQIIRQAVESSEFTRFDRCHFFKYGDFSLNFETVYYVLMADYTKYMDIQQAINLAIFEEFEREGIVFAFPTQTVHLKRQDPVA
jgi:small-conductance mechanosensitive channel